MTTKYRIAFFTNRIKNKLTAVTVQLNMEVVLNQDEKANIDLVNHPNYPDLEQYVLANPSKGKLSKQNWLGGKPPE